ncbi:DUF4398 domain-containing protein [Piscinibacter sakaiensis]|uniref:DUF4398 domain-containing protein n=1 Tax=Piscinibacter sakaiensis TaxID=1547922 RepID=A0A0K8P6T2_PISS1|nr:DUF4398 domain-containing protein [Piscinibacter sakaiensis]GAP38368.1 hypothetical protein ISF6_4826 [Piscinibacter sakaiensis]
MKAHAPTNLRPALWVLAGIVTTLAACAGAPPKEEVALGRAAVERATGPAAAEAPDDVARAREKIARANEAMARKDYGEARRLAQEAEADARLAEARARANRSEEALVQVRESLRLLQQRTAEAPATAAR